MSEKTGFGSKYSQLYRLNILRHIIVLFPGGKGGQCVRLTTLPPSCAEYHENLGTQTSWNPLDHTGPFTELLYIIMLPLFHSEFSRESDLVLPLSVSNIFSFAQEHPEAATSSSSSSYLSYPPFFISFNNVF
jgi:hypothetical protein